ncbi:MAG: HAD-IA family hydrolase [Muribaculaceae bacterium]|nr:HAD-IA family hydrolase [Muribaculaceae bacterium]
MIKAALIDMDGVLYDSMKYHTLAWKQMMEENGIECSRDEFYLYEGMTGAATIDLIWQREFGRPCDPERRTALYDYKTKIFKKIGGNDPMPGADRMLRTLCDRGIKCVLVTGSGQASLIDNVRKDYPGVFGDGMMVTAHDVTKGKPDPEPYLRGLEKAGVSPDEAIVIENAPLGVRAGVAAGIRTMAVCTGPIPKKNFEDEKAWGIYPSMNDFADMLPLVLDLINAKSPYILADSNTSSLVVDRLADRIPYLSEISRCVIPAGDDHKNIDSLAKVWRMLSENGATRRSTLFCIGGGMVTDLGGFAAATFKRGIDCINVSTTLLGMVDAATGGKTAINLDGLKNEIGVFSMPKDVVIIPETLDTLPEEELLSGYAEMLKTALIADPEMYEALLDIDKYLNDRRLLLPWILRCIEIKTGVTTRDPKEKGERKILNFGHTAGHAIESFALMNGAPLAHGIAVAHGLLWEMVLSATSEIHGRKGMFPSAKLYPFAAMLKEYYPAAGVKCTDIDTLISLMRHDKKNSSPDSINFTLLNEVGDPQWDMCPTEDEIRSAFELYGTLTGQI